MRQGQAPEGSLQPQALILDPVTIEVGEGEPGSGRGAHRDGSVQGPADGRSILSPALGVPAVLSLKGNGS